MVAMNPATAVCFLACGTALWRLAPDPPGDRARRIAATLGLLVAGVGLLKVLSLATGVPIPIDQLLFASRLGADGALQPNRMAPNTALTFLLLGISLTALAGKRPSRTAAVSALAVCFFALLAIVGYAFKVSSLYGVGAYIPMALNTALTFAALGGGVLLSRPRAEILRPIVASDAGGVIARRLLPFSVLGPIVLGWVWLRGHEMGLYEYHLPLSLTIVSCVALSVVFIWFTARSLGRADAERREAAEAIRLSNDSLEEKVRARTAELREREEQLRQSQKMDAIGRLAGGVAHDFNNLLTAILGYSQLIHAKLRPEDPLRHDTEEIEKAAFRAASLTRQLLAFSRQQVLQPRVMDLNAIIVDMGKMLRRLTPASIDFVTATPSRIGSVLADPGQIEQVILNLVVNARDAMPDGGKLTLETIELEIDAAYVRGREDLRPGHYVVLAVSDSGCGMDAETRSRVFEPFFTTKALGQGTGLGLSTVHGIVKQSGGHVEAYSEPGRGSVFKVYLPRVEGRAAEPSRPAGDSDLPGGTETVLIVEDEELVRGAVREALAGQGYQVLEAADGDQACRILEDRRGAADLVLTDVIMPNCGGPETVRRLLAIHPRLRVLYMSGYTDRAVLHHGILDAAAPFIQKPFTIAALLGRVREVLDSPRSEAA
jgi:signal transduction histidine kinase/CheY-like chemotaxis protein